LIDTLIRRRNLISLTGFTTINTIFDNLLVAYFLGHPVYIIGK